MQSSFEPGQRRLCGSIEISGHTSCVIDAAAIGVLTNVALVSDSLIPVLSSA